MIYENFINLSDKRPSAYYGALLNDIPSFQTSIAYQKIKGSISFITVHKRLSSKHREKIT